MPPNNRLQGMRGGPCFRGTTGLRAGPAPLTLAVVRRLTSTLDSGMRVLAIVLVGCLLAAATGRQPEFSAAETAAIYIAALNGEARQDPPREVALNRHLMSDAGYYTPSGLMPEVVVERLRAQGLFSEVCGDGPADGAGPGCISQHARGELRLSRPIPRNANVVDVYVGGGSIRPVNDTTTVFFDVGGTIRCRIVREGGRWVRRTCEQTMVV
jgi:hypothetical protein